MPAQNDVEMQYQAAAPMDAAQAPAEEPVEQKPQRTLFGMRGGGCLLDICACFICCEACDACCHAIDDCLCC